jgi:hypothetical protein
MDSTVLQHEEVMPEVNWFGFKAKILVSIEISTARRRWQSQTFES